MDFQDLARRRHICASWQALGCCSLTGEPLAESYPTDVTVSAPRNFTGSRIQLARSKSRRPSPKQNPSGESTFGSFYLLMETDGALGYMKRSTVHCALPQRFPLTTTHTDDHGCPDRNIATRRQFAMQMHTEDEGEDKPHPPREEQHG